MPDEPRRKFIRHPAHIAINVGYVNENPKGKDYLNNIGLGGIAFESNSYWKPGAVIVINILVNPPIQINGQVVWCKYNQNIFEVGVQFIRDIDCTKESKKKECQIKLYKQMLANIGTDMDDIIII